MTTAVFKLVKGVKSLDLMAGRYLVAEDFVPPAPATRPTLARGSSANRSGATRVVGVNVDERDFTFGLHVLGASEWENRRGIADVQAFLSLAGDESEPLYLEFKPNSDTPAPLWGQDGTLFYEILHGWAGVSELYAQTRDAALPQCAARLIVKGVAVGRKQRLCSAKGAAREDDIGKNFSRGLVVQAGPLTNLFTNPVFGNTTYDTGWTTAAALVSEKNTDENFTLFGSASARLYCITTATGAFTQSLTLAVETHVLSCYAKREDGAAVTASDLKIIYDTVEQTTTFISVGDGWYLLQASVTGLGIAAATGVSVQYPRQVYVDGFQALAAIDQRPFFYGDQLGCAWSGTAHASTSTQTATVLTITATDDTLREAQGCIRIVWRPHLANTVSASLATQYLFSSGASGLNAYYQASDDKFYFTDGTTTISTAAQTFGAFNILFLHFVWGPSGIAIYKDGASAASSASFDPVAAATLYLLCNSSSAQQAVCTAMDFTVFGVELTAAQVSDDYTNLTQVAADVERVGALPWLWTKDGDSIVDNCDDSTRDNWLAAGGLPGSLQAETALEVLLSSLGSVWISLCDIDYGKFLLPTSFLYVEQSGVVDANSSGGEYLDTSVNTGSVPVGITPSGFLTAGVYDLLAGREVIFFARMMDAGANLQIAAAFDFGNSETVTEFLSVTLGAAMRLMRTPPIVLPTMRWFKDYLGVFITGGSSNWTLRAKRSVAGAANVSVDYFAVLPRPIVKVSTITTGTRFVLDAAGAVQITSGLAVDKDLQMIGDVLELVPGKLNLLICFNGDTDANPTITNTLTFNRILITPRYALL